MPRNIVKMPPAISNSYNNIFNIKATFKLKLNYKIDA